MKKLVYHFFFEKNWQENKIYDIHFRCLDYYKDCFDEAYFALSFEDPNDVDSILDAKARILSIFSNLNKIELEMVENTNLYETATFKRMIVDRIGKDDLVFFAHVKGVRDIKTQPLEDVARRICGLYYFSLNLEKKCGDVTDALFQTTDVISYGSFLSQYVYSDMNLKNKHEWNYAGTFFWINSKRLAKFIKINDITLPECSDRFYDEDFLGNIYPIYWYDSYKNGVALAASHCQRYVNVSIPNFPEFDEQINYLIIGEEDEFNNFLKQITE